MTDDPFSADADPYPPENEVEIRFSRRHANGLILSLPILAAASGCAAHRLACSVRPDDTESCRHRFCRYYRSAIDAN
jgi:hypothetical protein